MDRIGIRELRQHASRWLRRVEAGESFEVTDRGRPVAVLAPVPTSDSEVARLIRSGEVRAPTGVRPALRHTRLTKGMSASQALAELRSEDAQ